MQWILKKSFPIRPSKEILFLQFGIWKRTPNSSTENQNGIWVTPTLSTSSWGVTPVTLIFCLELNLVFPVRALAFMREISTSGSTIKLNYLSDDFTFGECGIFFLTMAKNVKKLHPDKQIRVKMEVSNIVLRATLQAAHGCWFPQNSGYYTTLNSNSSSFQ